MINDFASWNFNKYKTSERSEKCWSIDRSLLSIVLQYFSVYFPLKVLFGGDWKKWWDQAPRCIVYRHGEEKKNFQFHCFAVCLISRRGNPTTMPKNLKSFFFHFSSHSLRSRNSQALIIYRAIFFISLDRFEIKLMLWLAILE